MQPSHLLTGNKDKWDTTCLQILAQLNQFDIEFSTSQATQEMQEFNEKILFKIFQNIPSVQLKELALVCKDWKRAVETFRVFEKLLFVETDPTDVQYLVASNRHYRHLDITVSQLSLGRIIVLLKQNEKTVEFLRIKVLRGGFFALFERKNYSNREMDENAVKFQNLVTFHVECYNQDDVMFLYKACDLRGIRHLATNNFLGRDTVVEHIIDVVPNITELQMLSTQRTLHLPPRVQTFLDDLEYASNKFFAEAINQVLVALIFIGIVGIILVYEYF